MRSRTKRVLARVGLCVLAAAGAARAAAVEPSEPTRLYTGLVTLVAGESVTVRARTSGTARSQVDVTFLDEHDTVIATGSQTASPGLPTKVRFAFTQLPGTDPVRYFHARVIVTPLDPAEVSTGEPDHGTWATIEAVGTQGTTKVVSACRPQEGGDGRATCSFVAFVLQPEN